MADPISILLEQDETRFVGVIRVTDYEFKLIIKNKKLQIQYSDKNAKK